MIDTLDASPSLPLSSAQIVARAERLVLDALPHRLSDDRLAAQLKVPVALLRYAFEDVRKENIYHALRRLRMDAARRAMAGDAGLSEAAAAYHFGFGTPGRFRLARTQIAKTTPADWGRA